MKPIIVFDTETTGMLNFRAPVGHDSQPHIVQLGAQLFDHDAKLKGELNLLIKPDGWTIPEEATKIHGISTEDCEKYGVPIRSALGLFNLWLVFDPILVAHNIEYDDPVMESEVKRLGKEPLLAKFQKVDTMKPFTELVKAPKSKGAGYKWPSLQELHTFLFGVGFDNAHDAMVDVRACAKSFFELRNRGLIK